MRSLLAVFSLLALLAVPMSGYAQMPFVMKPGVWTQYHNSPTEALDIGPALTVNSDGSLSENFPPCALNQRPNYLVAKLGGRNISQYKSVTFSVGVTADPTTKFVFRSPTNLCKVGCNPVSAKVIIWGPTADSSSLTNRWWAWTQSADVFVLAPGKATITVPLDGSHFTGVIGQPGLRKDGTIAPGFAATKNSVYAMGLTFGGGFYAGHGTCVQGGKASFQLYGYTLN